MDSRLCEKLNEFFLPHRRLQRVCTVQYAKAWNLVQNSLLYLAKNVSYPQQLYVRIRFEKNISFVTLSNGHEEISDVTLQSVKDIIPKAKNEGIRVESNLANNEFYFIFTPSNY